MNGLFQSIRFDLAVFICALLLTCILALLPPLNLGGIWVWFYCVPLFLALRLLPAGWFVLLLVSANTIIFFAVAISLERWLAINGSTIALFVTLLVVRSRVGTEYGLLTVLLFHLLIDLPVAIISRQVVANITFIEACFSAMGYSVGLLGSLIVSSIIMVRC